MKLLNGSELAGFIKERQAREIRQLFHKPKLAIVQCKDDPLIDIFVRLKVEYGKDIGVDVELNKIEQKRVKNLISKLNSDDSVSGIIVQLPLSDPSKTDEILSLIDPTKDVDALTNNSKFQPPTPTAILWLLAGYDIDLKDKKILIVGHGRLVGSPLKKMFDESSVHSEVADENTSQAELKQRCLGADIIISAAGSAGLLRTDMVKQNAVVVDAGTSSENGQQVGDVSPEVYERDDLTITPARGGVGPVTISALFENVIIAAKQLK